MSNIQSQFLVNKLRLLTGKTYPDFMRNDKFNYLDTSNNFFVYKNWKVLIKKPFLLRHCCHINFSTTEDK